MWTVEACLFSAQMYGNSGCKAWGAILASCLKILFCSMTLLVSTFSTFPSFSLDHSWFVLNEKCVKFAFNQVPIVIWLTSGTPNLTRLKKKSKSQPRSICIICIPAHLHWTFHCTRYLTTLLLNGNNFARLQLFMIASWISLKATKPWLGQPMPMDLSPEYPVTLFSCWGARPSPKRGRKTARCYCSSAFEESRVGCSRRSEQRAGHQNRAQHSRWSIES